MVSGLLWRGYAGIRNLYWILYKHGGGLLLDQFIIGEIKNNVGKNLTVWFVI